MRNQIINIGICLELKEATCPNYILISHRFFTTSNRNIDLSLVWNIINSTHQRIRSFTSCTLRQRVKFFSFLLDCIPHHKNSFHTVKMWFFKFALFIISLNVIAAADSPSGPPPTLAKAITKFAGEFYDVISIKFHDFSSQKWLK